MIIHQINRPFELKSDTRLLRDAQKRATRNGNVRGEIGHTGRKIRSVMPGKNASDSEGH